MASRLFKALAGTEHLNAGLECKEGQLQYNKQPLKLHQEGLQLYCKTEGCLPGVQHYRLLTPHAVSSGAKLDCEICLESQKFSSEQAMTSALQSAGWDQYAVLQWQPSWWHGRVDYYFPGGGVVMQVDGAAHFVANRKTRQPRELLASDLRFNLATWQHQGKLVRVHHADLDRPSWQVHVLAMSVMEGPLLVLSPSFTYVSWRQQPTDTVPVHYVEHMRLQLAAVKCFTTVDGYVWLTL